MVKGKSFNIFAAVEILTIKLLLDCLLSLCEDFTLGQLSDLVV